MPCWFYGIIRNKTIGEDDDGEMDNTLLTFTYNWLQ